MSPARSSIFVLTSFLLCGATAGLLIFSLWTGCRFPYGDAADRGRLLQSPGIQLEINGGWMLIQSLERQPPLAGGPPQAPPGSLLAADLSVERADLQDYAAGMEPIFGVGMLGTAVLLDVRSAETGVVGEYEDPGRQ